MPKHYNHNAVLRGMQPFCIIFSIICKIITLSHIYYAMVAGLQNYIVFANGRPVIGEDNEPVCVPAGSKLIYPNIDRTVTNSAGSLVTGEDRQQSYHPLTSPPPKPYHLIIEQLASEMNSCGCEILLEVNL